MRRPAIIAARFLVVFAALAVAAYVLSALRVVVVPFLLALMGASVLYPAGQWLKAHHVPGALASTLPLLVGLVVVLGASVFVVTQAVGQFDEVRSAITQGTDDIANWLETGPLHMSDKQVADLRKGTGRNTRSVVGVVTQGVRAVVPTVIEVAAAVLLTLVFTVQLLSDHERIGAWALAQFPERRRAEADLMGRRALQKLRRYVGGTALIGLFDATVSSIGLAVIGVPLIGPVAILFFFGAYLPLLGATFAGGVAVLIALGSGGLTKALVTLVWVLIVQQLDGSFVQPRVVGRAVRLHPLVVLGGVTAGVTVAGVIGGILAVPLIGIGAEIVAHMRGHDDFLAAPEPKLLRGVGRSSGAG